MELKNRVAITTGAGRGIGKAIALSFARAGADVALVSRTQSELEEVARLVRDLGRRALVVVADVSKPSNVSHMVRDTLAELGQIDILVNNAGISERKAFVDTTPEDWDRTLQINLVGVLLCSQAVLQHMTDRGHGKIINISSGAGTRGMPGNAVYSASKAGVNAFSQALAGEVRELGIQVNTICPGPIHTQMTAKQANPHNLNAFLEPEEVAGAALFLASELSGRITAQIIHVRNSDRW